MLEPRNVLFSKVRTFNLKNFFFSFFFVEKFFQLILYFAFLKVRRMIQLDFELELELCPNTRRNANRYSGVCTLYTTFLLVGGKLLLLEKLVCMYVNFRSCMVCGVLNTLYSYYEIRSTS